jgi:Mor family transcriptional regulator
MDDDTEDSSDEDNHAAPAEQQSLKQRKKNRLTKVSAMYDLDGDGELDEIELAMRKYDRDGDGQLSKNEIYKIVQEQLKEKKDASQLRKVTAGLVCFVFVLALSNLGTSFASAILAKETKADSNSATMILKGTGDALGTQTSGENFDMEPLSPEENRRRRELVVKRLIDEPHGHHAHHRRMANKNKKGGSSKNTNKKNKPSKQRPGGCKDASTICDTSNADEIYFDQGVIPIAIAEKILKKCDGSRTVNLLRKYDDGSTDSHTLCMPGTSVVKKNLGNGMDF